MKTIIIVLIGLLSFNVLATKKQSLRSKIGPTVHGPVSIDDKLYFLSTSGGLFKSDKEIKKADLIAETSIVTVSPLTHIKDFLFFGDGLHDNNKATVYRFNLKKGKIDKQIKIKGHMQREIAFDKGKLFVGLGEGGFASYDYDLNKKWDITSVNKKKLHVDSNPKIYKDLVCFTSIYSYKAVICVDKESGKLKHKYEFKESPKGELGLAGKYLYGFSSEADMMKSKFDIKAHLFVINLETNKLTKNIELRGYNFFEAPVIDKDNVLVNLSTGDILVINLESGKIEYVGEFPEPFVSKPFILGKEYCAIGIMGKLLCYKKGKNQYHITREKRLFESPVGNISIIDNKAYVPSRMGYFIIR